MFFSIARSSYAARAERACEAAAEACYLGPRWGLTMRRTRPWSIVEVSGADLRQFERESAHGARQYKRGLKGRSFAEFVRAVPVCIGGIKADRERPADVPAVLVERHCGTVRRECGGSEE